MGPYAMIFVFWTSSFKPAFSLSSFTLFKRPFSSWLIEEFFVLFFFSRLQKILFYNFFYWKLKWKPLSCVCLVATPWTIQSLEFSRPEYWSGKLPFCKGSSQCRDWSQVSCIADGFFTSWATREAPLYIRSILLLYIFRSLIYLQHVFICDINTFNIIFFRWQGSYETIYPFITGRSDCSSNF